MSIGIRIVSICDRESLGKSRAAILKNVGYEVRSFSSRNEPDASLVRESHIVIICRSVDEERGRALSYRFRSINRSIKILDLHALVDDDGNERIVSVGALLNLVENACGIDAMREQVG